MDFIVTEADTLASQLGRSVVTEVNIGMAWQGGSGLGFIYMIRGN
jgi:hypothetical protein